MPYTIIDRHLSSLLNKSRKWVFCMSSTWACTKEMHLIECLVNSALYIAKKYSPSPSIPSMVECHRWEWRKPFRTMIDFPAPRSFPNLLCYLSLANCLWTISYHNHTSFLHPLKHEGKLTNEKNNNKKMCKPLRQRTSDHIIATHTFNRWRSS